MYNNKSIGVVVPAKNEETQIEAVLKTMPVYVDTIIVVDDASTDRTVDIVKQISDHDTRITPGGAPEEPGCRRCHIRWIQSCLGKEL